jgi:hypothetical protein
MQKIAGGASRFFVDKATKKLQPGDAFVAKD